MGMLLRRSLLCILTLAPAALGCVEPNHGSRIIADFFRLGPPATVVLADANGMFQNPRYANPHYEMWATIADASVVRLFGFQVEPVVDPFSPCLMYDEDAERAYP